MGIAVTLPIVIGLQLGYFEVGLALSFGAFWCSPSDVVGSIHHKKTGILISAVLITVVSFIGGFLHYETWISLPILGVLSFGIAYISVYGFRASLISFSGLMALVLSFVQDSDKLEVYQYALLTGIGGLWYLLLVTVWHRMNPKAETEEVLTETFVLTAEFLETRGKLVGPQNDRHLLRSKLYKLQGELTKKHETLREILILSRRTSGLSNYQDKRLLIFVQLLDMLETAIANPVNYDRMDALFQDHPQYVKLFQKLIFEMAQQLLLIAEAGNDKNKIPKTDYLKQCLEDVQLEITSQQQMLGYERYLMLQNMLEYQQKQFKKLKRIKWLSGDPELMETDLVDRKTAKRFVALQDYDPKLLLRNFSFKSIIFRHSFRLAVTVMIGYALGLLFSFQNPYWVLLTIIVILRPNYGLTKNRAKDRIFGTIVGGVIAFGMIFLIRNVYAYGVMGVVSLIIAISMLQKNFKASAIFVTLSVVFIYAILSADVLGVIKFRIVDTLVGAALSYAAILWLWPTWEFVEINESIEKSVRANRGFLRKITDFYQQKGKRPTSYNIARKAAFLETSNLNSAFQRMTQEPRTKQKNVDKIYELVVLNHAFLASLASLSTYIQHHKTREASKSFKRASEKIEKMLDRVLQCVKDKKCKVPKEISENDSLFEQAFPGFNSPEIKNLLTEGEHPVRDLQEAHLIGEQLQWLYGLSSKMLQLVAREEVR